MNILKHNLLLLFLILVIFGVNLCWCQRRRGFRGGFRRYRGFGRRFGYGPRFYRGPFFHGVNYYGHFGGGLIGYGALPVPVPIPVAVPVADCNPYHYGDKALILGDAAHAMVPITVRA
ncbi:Kynurenine 3-monooxygenase [Lucilia cuprina]|nr:Kynurenine 3-monooxygenase [Lucilia cuprina]